MTHRIVLLGVAAFGIGGAAIAAPLSIVASSDSSITDDYWNQKPVLRPPSPWILSAEPMPKGVYLSGGFSFAEFQGRKFQLKDALLQVVPADAVMVYYDHQEYFVRGRSSGRVYLDNDAFGIRVNIARRLPDELSTSMALGFEYDAPGDMSAIEPNTTASYVGPKGYHTSFTASDGKRNHYQLTYSFVDGPGGASGHGYYAGYRRELNPEGRLSADLQLFAGFQSIEYVYNTFEFRGTAQLLGNYRIADCLNLEAGITYAPGGLPLTSNQLNGLSSFMIYRPGGSAGDITNDPIGFASIRLTYLVKF